MRVEVLDEGTLNATRSLETASTSTPPTVPPTRTLMGCCGVCCSSDCDAPDWKHEPKLEMNCKR